MKNKLTKLLAVVLAVVMAVVCVPVMDFDADIFTIEAEAIQWGKDGNLGGNVKWSYNKSKKTLTISGSGAMSDYSSTPTAFSDYNGTMVVTIMNNATKIVINNGVTNIGNNVFKGFKNVTSVSIPSSVKTIGNYAFNGCSSLSSVSIPSSVTSIGSHAFNGCTALSSANIPANVKSIGAYAFNGCTRLTSIEIPASITSLNNYIFNGCTALSSVKFNTGLKTIGEGTFKGCTKLSAVTIPATVTSLGKSAFEGCTSLSTVNLSEGITSIGAYCFKNTKFANVSLPYSVKSIGGYAFDGISGLKFTCNYDDAAHKYCKNYSKSYTFRTPELRLESSIDSTNKQLKVVVKIKNASGFNAANLNFTYDSTITPVQFGSNADTGDLSVIINGSTGSISVAAMAASCIPYEKCSGECEYTIATLVFNINGTNDSAAVTLSSKVFMSNDTRVTVASVSEKFNLHSYTSSKVTKTPTCKEEGVRTYTCVICNKTKTEPIAKDANNHASYGTQTKGYVAPTCGKTGYSGDKYCKGCDVKTVSGEVLSATGKHSYSGSVTKPATCAAKGEKTFVCSVCDDSYTEEIAINARNHTGNNEVRNASKETCAADGYTGDTYCKDCGTKIATGTVIKATGSHTYDAGTVTKAATCTETGVKTYTCSVCKTTKDEVIAKNPSNHTGGTEVRNSIVATCTKTGYTGDTYCNDCGEKIADGTTIPADSSNHSHSSQVIAPTCTEAGYTVYTCECGDTYTADEVQATGHSFGEDGKCANCDVINVTEIKFVADSGITVSELTDEATQETLKFVLSKNTVTASELLSLVDGEGWSILDAEANAVENDSAVATSYIIRHSSGAEYTVIILGDVNFDGDITASDARMTLRVSAELDAFNTVQAVAGDVTFDSDITASDARKILRVSAALDVFQ
ncbi:MAG: leucine-rich repeat protein [Clostridia bacterium]|nr:leucine-rich repeat protein [Clostridia bacterium]